jgi:ribosomal protein L22
MMPLFEHDPKKGRLTQTMTETLAEMERKRVSLMEDLARLAEQQKALQKEMRAIEKRHRDIARDLKEHTVPEDRELTLENVNLWCRSAYFNMAHTMVSNPHCYFARKKVREPGMYERVVRYIIENGYRQRYGNSDYVVLDILMNGTKWFLWPMTANPSESQVLNLKPVTLKPGSRPWAESPEGGAT